MKKIYILFLFFTFSHFLNAQVINEKDKKVIYDFVKENDKFSHALSWDNKMQLDGTIYISKEYSKKIEVYFFRVLISPSRAYLLVTQGNNSFIIGNRHKNYFVEIAELYNFLNLSVSDKNTFFDDISENLNFIYNNNLDINKEFLIKIIED